MKIKILGSCGGENFPASFCCCEHCEMARRAGGKSLRSLSQTFIDGDLLIDFPADTDDHCRRFGVNLGRIENYLITHSHFDHFLPASTFTRGKWGAHNMQYEDIYFYGPKNLEKEFDAAYEAIKDGDECYRDKIHFVVLEARKTARIGAYEVTPITAQHAPELGSLNYVIRKKGKTLLYLLDTGYPTEETLDYFETQKFVFDGVIMDATMGVCPARMHVTHMSFADNKNLKQELIARGLTNERTRFVATHFTHNQAETHEKIEEIFAGTGIEVSFDGFEMEI